MVAYEFYLRDNKNGDCLLGILPERRKAVHRINEESIMNWGRMVLGRRGDVGAVYYVPVKLNQK